MPEPAVPNHHAGHGRFRGPGGWLFAVRFLFRRGADARLACRVAEVSAADTLVDVGCGPGVAARMAARRGARVIGVDPAPPMLAVANLRRSARTRFVAGTAETLPIGDGECTVAWSLSTAHHFADVDAALREFHRVLAPRGRLLIMERLAVHGATGSASHGWTELQAEAFGDHAVRAGFVHVDWQVMQSRSNRRVVVLSARRPPATS